MTMEPASEQRRHQFDEVNYERNPIETPVRHTTQPLAGLITHNIHSHLLNKEDRLEMNFREQERLASPSPCNRASK